MYRTISVNGGITEKKVLDYVENSNISMLEDDAIIVRYQPRALGIWIMKNGKIKNPIDENADLDLTFEYNSDTTDAIKKWKFLLDTQFISFMTIRPDDISIVKLLGDRLPDDYKVSIMYDDGYIRENIVITFPDGSIGEFDIRDGHDYSSIIAYYDEKDNIKIEITVHIRFKGPRDLTSSYRNKRKETPIILSRGWTKEIKGCISGGSGGKLSYNEIFEGPLEYKNEMLETISSWYEEFGESISILDTM